MVSQPKASACTICPAGQYADQKNNVCRHCSSGTYSLGLVDVCTKCPTGSYSGTGETNCHKCRAGQTFDYQHKYCANCHPSFYSPNPNTPCRKCPAGQYSGSGNTSCKKCPHGTHVNPDQTGCVAPTPHPTPAPTPHPTPDPTPHPTPVQTTPPVPALVPCPMNTYSSTGFGLCDQCESPKVVTDERTKCVYCQPSFYRQQSENGMATECKKCPAGKISIGSGDICYDCSLGNEANAEQTDCIPIPPPPTPAPTPENIDGKCAKGEELRDGVCRKCPLNKYINERYIVCIDCPTNMAVTDDRTKCEYCGASFYLQQSENGEAAKCVKCPAGKISIGFGNFCYDCQVGYEANADQTDCIPIPPPSPPPLQPLRGHVAASPSGLCIAYTVTSLHITSYTIWWLSFLFEAM